MPFTKAPPDPDTRRARARALGLIGLVAAWDEVGREPWVDRLLACEEKARQARSQRTLVGVQRFVGQAGHVGNLARSLSMA